MYEEVGEKFGLLDDIEVTLANIHAKVCLHLNRHKYSTWQVKENILTLIANYRDVCIEREKILNSLSNVS